MNKKIAAFVALAAIVGVLAIHSVAQADVSWGYVKCKYGPHPEKCDGSQPKPQEIPADDPDTNKNSG